MERPTTGDLLNTCKQLRQARLSASPHVVSRPRPQCPLEPSVVSRFPRCADKVSRLARGIDKGDVLESPLNLRQLAALSVGGTRKVFREREVLHRKGDKGKGSGPVGPLSKLL